MNHLLLRTLPGAVYVALIVAGLLWGGLTAFSLICTLFALLGMTEFLRMTKGDLKKHRATFVADLAIGLSIAAFPALAQGALNSIFILTLEISSLILLRGVMQLYIRSEQPAKDIALSVLSVLYVAVPLMLAGIIVDAGGPEIMLLIFIMIWLNDTGAFLVGSAFGRHRLFERLSPKKSWEGFFGGLAFCLTAGYLAPVLLPGSFTGSSLTYVILGLIVCVFSTWGDLFESMIKRAAGVKDSGNILPGHGGILDRIDSILFVVPASLIYLTATTFIGI